MKLALSDIRIDGGTQARAGIDQAVVAEYAEGLEGGDVFPPLTVFHDGSVYWLADGFHRYHAYSKLEAREVEADVRQGDRRDAVLYSVGANATHGLRRTNEDKRRAVQVLLEDSEWLQWPNREIARRVGVSDVFVGNMKRELSANGLQMEDSGERTVTRSGTTYTQNTSKIGRTQPPPRPHPSYRLPVTPDQPEEDDRPDFDPYAEDHHPMPERARPSELEAISPEDAAEFLELANQPVPEETADTRMKAALRRDGYDEAERVGKHMAALANYSDGRLMEIVHSQSGQVLGLPRIYRLLMAELQAKALEVTA